MKTGSLYPLGASVTATGVNVSVFPYRATRAELLLFDTEDATRPSVMIDLVGRTLLNSGTVSILRRYFSDHMPRRSLWHYQRSAAARSGNNAETSAKSVVTDQPI
jgi:pullulanase/glycogen debranching enzyme